MPTSNTHTAAAYRDEAMRQRQPLLGDPLDQPLPPPTSGNRRRTRMIVTWTGGLLAVAVLLTVILNIDRSPSELQQRENRKTFSDVPAPPPLAQGEAATPIDSIRDAGMLGSERGWIQVTEGGRLAQEYRYARSDPEPDGRLRMLKPEVKVYLEDNRVLTMRGERALVHAPNKALESGVMQGDVVIRMFEAPAGRALNETVDQPLLEVRTHEASYDNFQGDIHCPGEVDIQTATTWLPAHGLRMQLNSLEGRPGQVTIDRIAGEVRLAEAAQQQRPERGEPAAAAAEGERPAGSNRTAARPSRERGQSAAHRAQAPPRQRERPRDRDRPAMPAPTPIQTRAGPYFYRLTLNQSVRIRQGDGTRGWVATGDQMHIIFSLDSDQVDQTASLPDRQHAHGPAEAMPLAAMMAALAIAQTPTLAANDSLFRPSLFVPSDSDTIITCEGPLTMVPLVNAAEQPASSDDSRFELIGSPVVLHNNDDATHITCATMQYASLSEVMELIASAQHPLVIDSPELYARSENRLWIDRVNNRGAFEGPGWMTAGESEPAAGGPPLPAQQRGEALITWQQGVDLEFQSPSPAAAQPSAATASEHDPSPHDSFGRLRLATFEGDVTVKSPDFTLDAEIMAVGFPPRPENEGDEHLASIEYMHAQRDVHVGSMSDGGSIACDDLRVSFITHEGKTAPKDMTASGGVAAVDREQQSVWADNLHVSFKPVSLALADADRADAAEAPRAGETPPAEAASRRRADVDALTATGAVQILMSDGGRAFADRLEADGEGNRIILTGDDVLVASDRTLIHRGTRLELTSRGEQVTWPGPGEFAYYTTAVLPLEERGRIARPVVDPAVNPRQMVATWDESMVYDGTYDGGAGSIVIRGGVEAESTPSPLERNSMRGAVVTLLFAKTSEADEVVAVQTAAPPGPPASQPQPQSQPQSQPRGESLFAVQQRGRQLRQIIAEGEGETFARMESHTWLRDDHADTSRVFYVAGPRVIYDDLTLEANVPGRGQLLVRDERLEEPASQPAAPQTATAARKAAMPFGGKGTTMFRWSESLHMRRQANDSTLYDIDMVGNVEVTHRALDQAISTMTGDRLEATVDRSAGDAESRDTGFDLGGSMDLRRVRAVGNVYVDSPTRDVDCDEFDYDYVTGVAKLLALPDRMVTVATANNPNTVRARAFVWNTITDTVQATNISGSSGR